MVFNNQMNKFKKLGLVSLILLFLCAGTYLALVFVTSSSYTNAYLKVNQYFKNSNNEFLKALRIDQEISDRDLFHIRGRYIVSAGNNSYCYAPFETEISLLSVNTQINLSEIFKNADRKLKLLPLATIEDDASANLSVKVNYLTQSFNAVFNISNPQADSESYDRSKAFMVGATVKSDNFKKFCYKVLCTNYYSQDPSAQIGFSKLALNGKLELDDNLLPVSYGDSHLVLKDVLLSELFLDSVSISAQSSKPDENSEFVIKLTLDSDADDISVYKSLYATLTVDRISREAMLNSLSLNQDNYLENFSSVKKLSLTKFFMTVPAGNDKTDTYEYKANGEFSLDAQTLPKSLNGFLNISTDADSALNSFLKADEKGCYSGKLEVRNGQFYINGISLGTTPYKFLMHR